jgi:hypothetical protein
MPEKKKSRTADGLTEFQFFMQKDIQIPRVIHPTTNITTSEA